MSATSKNDRHSFRRLAFPIKNGRRHVECFEGRVVIPLWVLGVFLGISFAGSWLASNVPHL